VTHVVGEVNGRHAAGAKLTLDAIATAERGGEVQSGIIHSMSSAVGGGNDKTEANNGQGGTNDLIGPVRSFPDCRPLCTPPLRRRLTPIEFSHCAVQIPRQ
jgi:hypothetical protein